MPNSPSTINPFLTDIGNRENSAPNLNNNKISPVSNLSNHLASTKQFNYCRGDPPTVLPTFNPIPRQDSSGDEDLSPLLIYSPNLETPYFTPYSPPNTPFGSDIPTICCLENNNNNNRVEQQQCCINNNNSTTSSNNNIAVLVKQEDCFNNNNNSISLSNNYNNIKCSSSSDDFGNQLQFSSSQSSTTSCCSNNSTFEILAVSKKDDYEEDEDDYDDELDSTRLAI